MAQVSIRELNKKYDNGFHAVKDVNLEVRDKEFLVLVGPSGCGKTTTLRMVAGLEEVTSGDIRIGERVVNGLPPMDRDIAMVFQNYALYPHKTVFDNMAFGLQMRHYAKDEIDRRVRDAGRDPRHRGAPQRKPRQLSGGQRQRVRGRARHRAPSAGVSVRRAAVQSRRQAAGADARGAEAPARDAWRRRRSTSRTIRSRR